MKPAVEWHFRFEPAPAPDAPCLLLLHGTGGDEHDLISLGRALLPEAALLSPRGRVLEHGMPRFFRRLAQGAFDLDDLVVRARELSDFVYEAGRVFKLDLSRMIAVGFSNGANVAAAMMLLRPDTVGGAILFRAIVPFTPDRVPDLTGRRIFLSAALHDPLVPVESTEEMAELFRKTGAAVALDWRPGGHELDGFDIEAARQWLGYTVSLLGASNAR
jgi:phospholipase/carboxylesterase/glyoxalase family protein